MKVLIVFFVSFFSIFFNVYAEESSFENIRQQVELIACTSAEDIWVKKSDETIRIRLIAYDTDDTELNNEINEFYCSTLENAMKVEIEYDIATTDKYNRELVHIFVDDESLAQILLSKGYGQVNYVEGDYKYLDDLCETQKNAILNNLGIWSTGDVEEKYCESNVDLKTSDDNSEEESQTTSSFDINVLHKIIFISSAILLLMLLIRLKK